MKRNLIGKNKRGKLTAYLAEKIKKILYRTYVIHGTFVDIQKLIKLISGGGSVV